MCLEEISGSAKSLCRKCHAGHKLAVADGLAVSGRRALHAVGAVHDHRGHDVEHVGDVAEVHDKVVIAKAIAALGEPNLLGTAVLCF